VDSVASHDITLIKRPGKVALLEEAIKKGEWPLFTFLPTTEKKLVIYDNRFEK